MYIVMSSWVMAKLCTLTLDKLGVCVVVCGASLPLVPVLDRKRFGMDKRTPEGRTHVALPIKGATQRLLVEQI